MTALCTCCHRQTAELGERELCPACVRALDLLGGLTTAMRGHVLAHALDRSTRSIAHRLGCTTSAHSSALSNATRTTGLPRDTLLRAATWALRGGIFPKPAGFEDVRLPGEVGSTSGEVTVRQMTPEEKVRAMRTKRRAGAPVRELAREYGVVESTVEAVTEGIDPEPAEPESIQEEEPPVVTATEVLNAQCDAELRVLEEADLARAKEHVEQAEAAYRAAFAALAIPALAGGPMPDMELVRLAHDYGRAKGGFEVMAAMVGEG
jgi:transposase-like protein